MRKRLSPLILTKRFPKGRQVPHIMLTALLAPHHDCRQLARGRQKQATGSPGPVHNECLAFKSVLGKIFQHLSKSNLNKIYFSGGEEISYQNAYHSKGQMGHIYSPLQRSKPGFSARLLPETGGIRV